MLKEKLNQLHTSLTNLKEKLVKFKEQTTLKLNDSQSELSDLRSKCEKTNHKLELSLKEQKDNERVLEQLLKEMGELEESL
jgi:hypothetical protein